MGKHRNRKVNLAEVSYDVGYGKTDPKTRFKNGNTAAKSKKRKRKEKTQEDYYSEIVSVTRPDGAVVKMTRREMAYDKNSILAAKGDHRAFKILLEHENRKAAGEVNPDPLVFNEDLRRELLEDYKKEDAADPREGDADDEPEAG